jgi:hypothetical protein
MLLEVVSMALVKAFESFPQMMKNDVDVHFVMHALDWTLMVVLYYPKLHTHPISS